MQSLNPIHQRQRRRADRLLSGIRPYLKPVDRILDIGSGNSWVAEALIRSGHHVTLLDTADKSKVPGLHPIVFDGKRLPFDDDAFDVALLLTVLHHIPMPDNTLSQARRVASRIIVIEDVYESTTEKWLTWLADSWVNWEWRGHPHSNRSDAEWRASFQRLNLQVDHAHQRIEWLIPWRFRHAAYVLSRV